MIAEFALITIYLVGGSLLALTAGIRSWVVPAVGYPVGVALYVALTTILTVMMLPLPAWTPLVFTVAIPLAVWLAARRRGDEVRLPLRTAGLVAIITFGIVAGARVANLLAVTPDSFSYLETAGLIARGLVSEAPTSLLQDRVMGVPALHAPAAFFTGEFYLQSATPLFAICCLALVVWLLREGVRAGRHPVTPWSAVVAGLAVLVLVTNNRFLFHAFYVNGHLAIGTWVLILAGMAWILLSADPLDDVQAGRLLPIQALTVIAITLTRPDGALLAAITLLPLVVSQRMHPRSRWILTLVLGVTILVWTGFLALRPDPTGQAQVRSIASILLIGIALVAGAAVLRHRPRWVPRGGLGMAEFTLWSIVGLILLRSPDILIESAHATRENLIREGGWGSSLFILAAACAVVIVCCRTEARRALRFPVTAFLPLGLLLAHVRGIPYRIGPGDSLTRMFIHVVPLAVLLIGSALNDERLAWPTRRPAEPPSETGTDADPPRTTGTSPASTHP